MIFIIDQGHREDTPGKRYKDFREYEFNEDVAQRLKLKLEEAGQKVILTMISEQHNNSEMNSNGRVKNLQHRCDIANTVIEESVFISIHANAFDNEEVSGYSVFHYPTSVKGKKLAQSIHDSAKKNIHVGTEIKDRGIKTETFYVLRNTRMPAILIEHEFYTNDRGRERLENDKFRDKCVDHIFEGLMDYAGIDIQLDYKDLYTESQERLQKAYDKLNKIINIIDKGEE